MQPSPTNSSDEAAQQAGPMPRDSDQPPTDHSHALSAPTDSSRRRRGILMALGGVSVASTNFVTIKYALCGVNPFTFLPLWFVLTGIYSATYLAVCRVPWRAQLRRHLRPLAIIAVCNGLWGVGFFVALQWLDPTVLSFLNRAGAIYAILLGYFFLGERFAAKAMIGMALILAGVGAITYGSGRAELLGIVLSLTGYFFGSVNFLFTKRIISVVHPVLVSLVRSIGAVVIGGIVMIAAGAVQTSFAWQYGLVLLLGSLFGEFGAYVLIIYSMRFIGLSEMEILRATQPLFVVVYSLVFIGLLPDLRQGLGGIVVVIGVLVLTQAHSVERGKFPAKSQGQL